MVRSVLARPTAIEQDDMHLLLIKSLRDIQRRPLRSLLTVVGVILGVAGVVAISYAGRSLITAQRDTYANTHQPDITISVAQISPSLADLLEHRDNIAAVDTRAQQRTRVSNGHGWISTKLLGVDDFSAMRLDAITLLTGHFPGHGEVAFDASVASLAPIRIGDLVALQSAAGAPVTYARVSGFVQAPARLDAGITNTTTAFMPATEVRHMLGIQENNLLLVRTKEPQRATETATEIRKTLDTRGITSYDYHVRDPDTFAGSRELQTVIVLLEVFSVLGAVLSSFLVANTMAAVMTEESRQIGIIKALGGTRWDAMRTYLAFAGVIGATGTVAGWILGLIGGRFLTSFLASLTSLTLPPFSLSPREIVLASIVGAGVTVGATALPAWVAVRQRAARLLANVGVTADFQRGTTKRLTEHAGRAGAIVAMGLRNLARRPTRAWATLAVVAVAVAAFLGTQAVSRSVSISVDRVYGLYEAQGWISFAKPVDASFARVLDTHPDVAVAEPWDLIEASIGSVRTQIIGIPSDTQIYTPRITAGTWLGHRNPPAAVLTTNLERKLKAKVGEIVTLDAGRRSMLVQVAGIVNDESTYLEGSTVGKVFLGVDDAQRLIGRGSQASLFALKLRSSAPADVDWSLASIEHRFQELHPVTLSTHMDQESSRRAISILTVMLDAMVLIIGIVGLAGIVNTLLINLAERRREFGVLRALGATSRHMMRLVMTEALGLALIGCLIGVLVGYPLAHYLVQVTGEQLFKLEFHLGPMTVLSTLIVALAAAAAVSTGPGLIATRIRPIQVLRYE
ncbi:conserved membrane hypothetical protein [Nitrolancea hollandica Lb]|uniref:ABC transporter permease n=2 Tax=Nitrolancea hollandica TaxID=1206749 RepID=I4EIB8_9BACT|nr:conserved membrane hypothetical protein [Nitrolancea hollandica Lb]